MLRRILAIAATGAAIALAALPAAADGWQKLMSPEALADALSGDGLVVIDIRDPSAYLTAHLPGAINAPYPLWRGPAENPGQPLDAARLTELLRAIGLTPESRAVVTHAGVNQSDFGAAARVYWTLKTAGLEKIAILNGGVRGWIGGGGALSVDPSAPTPSKASFEISDAWTASRDEVAAATEGDGATLVDGRPAEFHAGAKKHPAAKAAGTLTGAANVSHETWFDGHGTDLAPSERIAKLAEDAGLGTDGEATVSFCNTGHWAATGWFALSEMAGIEGVKLYPESMVGWTGAGGEVQTAK